MEKSPTKKFLIDGFPRNEDNLSGWNKQMGEKTDFKFVLFFECGEQVGVFFFEFNRVPKCDVIKFSVLHFSIFMTIFQQNMMKNPNTPNLT